MALPEGQEWRLPPAYEEVLKNHPLFKHRNPRPTPTQFAGKRPLQPPPSFPPSSPSNHEVSSAVGSDEDSSMPESDSDFTGSHQNLTHKEKRQLLKLRIRLPLKTCYVVARGSPSDTQERETSLGAEEQERAESVVEEPVKPVKRQKTEHTGPVMVRLRLRDAYGSDEDGFFMEPRRSAVLVEHRAKRERRRRESMRARRKRRQPRGATVVAHGVSNEACSGEELRTRANSSTEQGLKRRRGNEQLEARANGATHGLGGQHERAAVQKCTTFLRSVKVPPPENSEDDGRRVRRRLNSDC